MKLQLILKGQYFDEILTGKKTTEYRDASNYNVKLFSIIEPIKDKKGNIISYDAIDYKPFKEVIFHHGYASTRRSMVVELKNINYNEKTDKFELSLGRVLSTMLNI